MPHGLKSANKVVFCVLTYSGENPPTAASGLSLIFIHQNTGSTGKNVYGAYFLDHPVTL